jgi:4-hydroxythreonine-4-phosphate dehydrogenase
MGEPAGIGPELILAAWLRRADGVPPFVALADPDHLGRLASRLGWKVDVASVADAAEAASAFPGALPVLPLAGPVSAEPGRPHRADARLVVEAIERAVALTTAGEVGGLVTEPIHKHALQSAGFGFPGHTEFLGHLAGPGANPVMMLAVEGLRVVPVTVHVPILEVPRRLTTELIVAAGRTTAVALARDFGLASPRLAVAGLNPHAGEAGAIGREEIEVIVPAVERLRGEGIAVAGPFPADSLFHPEARARYDAALCMYHDQALVPLKTIDFHNGVNVTIGLPFVRTSPDHGTAFDIAGTGRARPDSTLAALRMARAMADARARLRPSDG